MRSFLVGLMNFSSSTIMSTLQEVDCKYEKATPLAVHVHCTCEIWSRHVKCVCTPVSFRTPRISRTIHWAIYFHSEQEHHWKMIEAFLHTWWGRIARTLRHRRPHIYALASVRTATENVNSRTKQLNFVLFCETPIISHIRFYFFIFSLLWFDFGAPAAFHGVYRTYKKEAICDSLQR